MFKPSFSDTLAVIGLILAIVLVVLDKAGKLKGPMLLILLAVAAALTLPLALSFPWVIDASPGILKFSRGMLMVFGVGLLYSIVAVWISGPEVREVNEEPKGEESSSSTRDEMEARLRIADLRRQDIQSERDFQTQRRALIDEGRVKTVFDEAQERLSRLFDLESKRELERERIRAETKAIEQSRLSAKPKIECTAEVFDVEIDGDSFEISHPPIGKGVRAKAAIVELFRDADDTAIESIDIRSIAELRGSNKDSISINQVRCIDRGCNLRTTLKVQRLDKRRLAIALATRENPIYKPTRAATSDAQGFSLMSGERDHPTHSFGSSKN